MPRGVAKDGHEQVACTEHPNAYLVNHDPAGPLSAALTRAGFAVAALPLDRDPRELKGTIVFDDGISKDVRYQEFVDRYAEGLYHFVDRANVLVQLAQEAAHEREPPFLPTTQGALRGGVALDAVSVTDETHPLLQRMPQSEGWLNQRFSGLVPESFLRTEGFAPLLAGKQNGDPPVLVEGAYGQGRIVLSALPLGAARKAETAELAATFFANLRGEVKAVCERKTKAIALGESPLSAVTAKEAFTLVALPDTQVYSLRYPGLFSAQTAWIADHVRALDIRYVFHLGDIVNNNTDLEWMRAWEAMSWLNDAVPYAIATGNHDYGPSGDASDRTTLLNDYFPFEVTRALPSFGGAYKEGQLDNTYHLFSAGGRDFIVMALEWGPRDEVVEWANEVMHDYPERLGILIVHAYLNNNDLRYDHTDKAHPQSYNPHEYALEDVNDGEELWQKLVSKHRFVMTLNGHVLGDGTGYLASKTELGNTCHQMLSNYQMRDLGGEGYLRILQILPNARVNVFTYSVLYDRLLDEPDQTLSFDLDI
jgi:hypothetical protein